MSAQQILRTAADITQSRGWCEGQFLNSEGQCCAIGAIMLACDIPENAVRAHVAEEDIHGEALAAAEHLADFLNLTVSNWPQRQTQNAVTEWNDNGHLNQELVVSTLRKAANA